MTEFRYSTTRPSTEYPRSPTLVDVPCQYTFLTGEATADGRARAERVPSATYSLHSRRSREPSGVSVPAGAGPGTRLVARLRTLFPSRDLIHQYPLSRSISAHPHATNSHTTRTRFRRKMSRPSSWFVKKENAVHVDATVLGNVNVPAGGRSESPAVVVDASTLANVNVPCGVSTTINLTADQLGSVNVPSPQAAAKVLELTASDLANINVPSGENSKAATPTLSRTASRVVEVRANDLANVNQREA